MTLKSSHLLKYENKWVALSRGKVVAAHGTIQGIYKKLEKVKNRPVALMRVLPFNSSYSPHGN